MHAEQWEKQQNDEVLHFTGPYTPARRLGSIQCCERKKPIKPSEKMITKQLATSILAILIFGCGKQHTAPTETESVPPPIYQAYALMHFQGGNGPETLFANHVQHFETEAFQAMVHARFSTLWAEQDNLVSVEKPPSPGNFSFEPTNGFVKLTAEASEPKVAVFTANAVALSMETLYMDIARRSSDESVAWLKIEAEKQKKELQDIDQGIRALRSQKDMVDQLTALLKRREVQIKIYNGIEEKIEEERLKHDQNAVSIHILERAEKAHSK